PCTRGRGVGGEGVRMPSRQQSTLATDSNPSPPPPEYRGEGREAETWRADRRTAATPRALPEPDPRPAARPAQDLPRFRRRRRQDLRDAPGGPAAQAAGG